MWKMWITICKALSKLKLCKIKKTVRKIWRNGREHKKIAKVIDFWANSQIDEWNFAAS